MNAISVDSDSIYFLHRRFEFDLEWCEEKLKRIALAYLPFIAMYRPAGMILTVGSNTSRVITQFNQAWIKKDHNNWEGVAKSVGKIGISLLALHQTFFDSKKADLITTGSDLVQGAYHCSEIYQGNREGELLEELFQILSSLIYLCFLISGNLELLLILTLLQSSRYFCHSMVNLKNSFHIEASSKALLGILKLSISKEIYYKKLNNKQ